MTGRKALVVVLLLLWPSALWACSLCQPDFRQRLTWREEAAQPQARLVLFGVIRPNPGSGAELSVQFHVTEVLRDDPARAGRKVVIIPRYLPTNEKNPPQYLVFCDVGKGGALDVYQGIPLRGAEAVDYFKRSLAFRPDDRAGNLLFQVGYLEHADPDVARNAFLEVAKASDADLGRVAPKLDRARVRAWLEHPQTPPERLSLYALLLGACGNDGDADYLKQWLAHPESERVQAAYDGLLVAYTLRRPADGWQLAEKLLGEDKTPVATRLPAVRMVRFFMGAQPESARPRALRCAAAMLRQGEYADIAVEDLRRWKVWDLTADVLAQYGRPQCDSPLMRGALARYALSCPPDDRTRAFLAELRRKEPETVTDAEESLRFEKR